MKKILVPTDFSTAAAWAVEVAADIATRAHAEIILLHIVEQPMAMSFNASGQIATGEQWEDRIFTLKLIEKNKEQLAQFTRRLTQEGITVREELRLGNPFHGIQTMIADHQVDLIIMGTKGHSRIEELLIGSTTEKVVRFAKCPVLSIHSKPTGDPWRNMVYATSMSKDELAFATVVKDIQNLFNNTIHVVRINTPLNFRPDHEVKIALNNFAQKARLKNYTLNIFNDMTEEDGILRFAASLQADLIAMATHGRTGIAHVVAGSIAENIANHSSRPVLISKIATASAQEAA